MCYLVEVTINYEHIDFKNRFDSEIYCKIALPFSHRNAIAKFRCGRVASLRIEKNRIKNLRVEERICCFCSGVIEDETQVFLNCPFYDDFRENLFNVANCCIVDFMSFNNEEKIMLLFSNVNMIKICAKTCFPI